MDTAKFCTLIDHHIDAAVGGEAVQLVEIRAGIDEEPGLLAVVLHEMILRDLEGFLHAFADGDGRHHDDELAPAIALVQLEHRLDVHIGFARAGFHLHIQTAAALALHQYAGLADVVFRLDGANIVEQLAVGEDEVFVEKAGIVQQDVVNIRLHGRQERGLLLRGRQNGLDLADVAPVFDGIGIGLPGEHARHRVDGVGLVLLYFEAEFHIVIPRPQYILSSLK